MRLNLDLVLLHLFCVVNACFRCVRFSFLDTKPKDWPGETSPNDLFCVKWGIKPQLNHQKGHDTIYSEAWMWHVDTTVHLTSC